MDKMELFNGLLQSYKGLKRGTPFYSTLFLTPKCNSNCYFCNTVDNSKENMSFDNITKIIDEMKDFGVHFLALTGGEPLIRSDIFEILKYIESKKMVYSMVSNGTLWTEDRVNEIRKRKIFTLSISLDSLKDDVYKDIRGIHGLPLVKKTFNLFRDKPLRNGFLSSLTTVTYKNIGEVQDIINFDRENGVRFQCGPVSAGDDFHFRSSSPESLRIGDQTAINLFQSIADQCSHDPVIIGPAQIYQNMANYFRGNYRVPCDAGKVYMSVNALGGVSVCQDFPTFGNVLTDGLKTAFKNKTSDEKIQACAKKTPCFYGCTTVLSMMLRAPFLEKAEMLVSGARRGTV
jgi:MoaA/NifB/PqqE/SkfB family radical SAM enzyme